MSGGGVLRPAVLAGVLPGLVAAFSTALPRQADDALAERLVHEAGAAWGHPPGALPRPVLLRQTHSATVLALDPAPPAGQPADGLWAAAGAPHLLAVKTADCVPLLAVDATDGRYGALHAGWRGAAVGILPALLAAWRRAGGDPAAVHLELGPHIQGCCYEVQADCLAAFPAELLRGAVRTAAGRTWLALAAVLRAQAEAAGVPARQVHVSPHCTYCHRTADGTAPYASYRRASHAGEAFAETNVGLIGLLP